MLLSWRKCRRIRGERWKRFIKLFSPSSCQSVAVPGRAHSSSAPAMFPKCLEVCCQPLSLMVLTARSGALRATPVLCAAAWSPFLLRYPLCEHHKQPLLKEVLSSTNLAATLVKESSLGQLCCSLGRSPQCLSHALQTSHSQACRNSLLMLESNDL